MPRIKCECCGYEEEANKEFFFKVLGGGMVGFGGYAWIAYLFAGTGFALAICVAIVVGTNIGQPWHKYRTAISF